MVMIDFRYEEVQRALTDSKLKTQIYNQIFGNDRVKKWLTTRGFFNQDTRDEIHSQLVVLFLRCFTLYHHSKQPFEKFVWGKFNFHLMNHIQGKMNGRVFQEIDEISEITFHTGHIDDAEMNIDIQIIRKRFTGNTRTVFDAMSKGLTRKDMPELGLGVRVWDNERLKIQEVMKQFEYVS